MCSHREFMQTFEENVQFMTKVVAPDDIYQFAEQLHIAGVHFLKVLNDNNLLKSVYDNCTESRVWANNLMSYQICKDKKEITPLNVGFREISD